MLQGRCHLPGPGIEPVSPVLVGRFLPHPTPSISFLIVVSGYGSLSPQVWRHLEKLGDLRPEPERKRDGPCSSAAPVQCRDGRVLPKPFQGYGPPAQAGPGYIPLQTRFSSVTVSIAWSVKKLRNTVLRFARVLFWKQENEMKGKKSITFKSKNLRLI